MYTQQDFIDVKNTALRRVIAALGLACLFLAGLIVCLVVRAQTVGLITAGAGFIVVFFLWSFKVTPWTRYNRFMKDMKEGQRRYLECEYLSMEKATRLMDGVEVYDFHVTEGTKEEDERLFEFDSNKPVPELKAGDKIKVTSFGNHIVDIEKITADNGYNKALY